MDRRGVLSLLGVSALGLIEGRAFASVARGLSLRDLVLKSKSTVVVTPLARQASWQTIGGARRIVTETRARVEQLVSGSDPSATEVLVQTLGGRVGHIGQIVEGEAEVAVGEGCLAFLSEIQPLIYRVTAMAQGHYPIANEARGRVLLASRAMPALLRKQGSAVERLSGKLLAEGIELVRAERK
jgi:hypothetical protein